MGNIKDDLSKGNYLMYRRGFQIEAFVNPIKIVDGVGSIIFDLELFKESNYNSFLVVLYSLRWFPSGAGDQAWSVLLEDNRELEALEIEKMNNIVRVQYEDDNLNPNNQANVNLAGDWFDGKRQDPNYDHMIFTVNMSPYGYSQEEKRYFFETVKPDLVFFNRYPHTASPTLHPRQIEYGWYAMLHQHRKDALEGLDGTGAKPIPFGAYTQTFWNNMPTPISDTLMAYNSYLSACFGAKYLSSFVYTDFTAFDNLNEDLRTILFDEDMNPTSKFYTQARVNKGILNLGKALTSLQTVDVRMIRATNIEHFVQSNEFAGGVYGWHDTPRPDENLRSVRAKNKTHQDIFVGFFNPIHESLDGTNSTDENYFMIVNGNHDTDENTKNTTQKIRMTFKFPKGKEVDSLVKINRDTGELEKIALNKRWWNKRYFVDIELKGGEGDLFKYDNGVKFIGL